MSKHQNKSTIPPTQLSVITKVKANYKYWQNILPNLPKTFRTTLGEKIDGLYLELIENLFIAEYIQKDKKAVYVVKSLTTCDLLKAFLQIAWENKHIKDKQFVILSEGLVEINKMLFGWRQFLEKNPE